MKVALVLNLSRHTDPNSVAQLNFSVCSKGEAGFAIVTISNDTVSIYNTVSIVLYPLTVSYPFIVRRHLKGNLGGFWVYPWAPMLWYYVYLVAMGTRGSRVFNLPTSWNETTTLCASFLLHYPLIPASLWIPPLDSGNGFSQDAECIYK